MTKTNITTLHPSDIIQLGNLRFQAKTVVEGFLLGIHASPYHGFSVEFSQHRPYIAGDDTKNIDWTLYGKTDRYYIRQYREDTNLSAYILLDNSRSMNFRSDSADVSKFQYARIAAASLIHLLMKQNDAAGLTIFNSSIDVLYPPRAVRSYESELFKSLQTANCSGETNIGDTLHHVSEKLGKKGLVILISDCLDKKETILNGLKHLRFLGHDVLLIQILDPGEWILSGNEKTRFTDMENGRSIQLDVRQIRDDYHRRMKNYTNHLHRSSGEIGADHSLILTNEDCRTALWEFFKKRQRLA